MKSIAALKIFNRLKISLWNSDSNISTSNKNAKSAGTKSFAKLKITNENSLARVVLKIPSSKSTTACKLFVVIKPSKVLSSTSPLIISKRFWTVITSYVVCTNASINARYALAIVLPSSAKSNPSGVTLDKSISVNISFNVSTINTLTDGTCKIFKPNNFSIISAYKSCLNGIATSSSAFGNNSVNSPRSALIVAINSASATL